jgi:selenocysteine lyase/cysteine desulfurase
MTDTIDVARARAETPGCERVAHLNNAGAALPTAQVLDAQVDYLRAEAAGGGYETEAARQPQIEATYDNLAELVGAHRDEIAVTDSASRAWHTAFTALRLQRGDRVLTGRSEYVSSALSLILAAERSGVEFDVVGDDEHGQLDVAELERRLDDPRVRLVALTHVPTSGGLINPVEAAGALTRAAGVPFLLDACQSVGQLPVDVEAIGCDLLAATGRKYLRGPRGTGFLYVRRTLLDRLAPPSLDGDSARWTGDTAYEMVPTARRFESFERSYAGHVGLGVAAQDALRWGMTAIGCRVVGLGAQLRVGLADIPGVRVHDRGERLGGIVTFAVAGLDGPEVVRRLRGQGVNVWATSPSAARWDLAPRGLASLVRASVHYYNDQGDLDRLLTCVSELTTSS